MGRLSFASLLAVSISFMTAQAMACSCRPLVPATTHPHEREDVLREALKKTFDEADAIIRGVFIERNAYADESYPGGYLYESIFQVMRYWKGDGQKEIGVIHTTIDSICGVDFELGQLYQLLAYDDFLIAELLEFKPPKGLSTNICAVYYFNGQEPAIKFEDYLGPGNTP